MDRRDGILHTAKRLFGQYGPQKTTIADIAREAGVGVGTVYLEFASKEAIVEELSRRRHDQVLHAMKAALEARGSWADRLRAALSARTAAFLCKREDGLHASDLLHCGIATVKAVHHRFLEEERAVIEGLLVGGVRAGEFDVADPKATASVVLRAYATFTPPWLFGRPREEIEAPLAAMHELVLRGLIRRPPAKHGSH